MLKKLRSSKGATIIEYALIASLVAVVAIAGMRTLGNKINHKMQEITANLNG